MAPLLVSVLYIHQPSVNLKYQLIVRETGLTRLSHLSLCSHVMALWNSANSEVSRWSETMEINKRLDTRRVMLAGPVKWTDPWDKWCGISMCSSVTHELASCNNSQGYLSPTSLIFSDFFLGRGGGIQNALYDLYKLPS